MVIGTKLGPYEIVAPLGAGGMGEVYRARDTRLGRDVAIKTLPAAFAQDPERRARFESESQAVAALSHPNVLAIHDVGAEGDAVFAVMELVEGETLRERLVDGALPGSRAVGIAIQVARGLPADARSDLFALGALLYEMLSGRRAFEAESAADVMSAILREAPADLVARVPDVSPAITRLVSRCLEKDPAARFRSAADVAFALEAIGTASSSSRAGGAQEAARISGEEARAAAEEARLATPEAVPWVEWPVRVGSHRPR
jgi:serine/threonine protein kinase